jgi:hypothetical protein
MYEITHFLLVNYLIHLQETRKHIQEIKSTFLFFALIHNFLLIKSLFDCAFVMNYRIIVAVVANLLN